VEFEKTKLALIEDYFLFGVAHPGGCVALHHKEDKLILLPGLDCD
jgi:hypothetical protein